MPAPSPLRNFHTKGDHNGPLVLTVVSGKGGVGKTLIASSIAACIASGNAKVLMIDLDFENQGLTSLLAAHFKIPESTGRWFPIADEMKPGFNMLRIRDGLYFLPAPSTAEKELLRTTTIADQFSAVLANVQERVRGIIDIVILDCHGSSDPLTRVAVSASDKILLVTEPDPIAFGGSLEWLFEVREQVPSAVCNGKMLVVANRVLPRFRVQGLRETLREAFAEILELRQSDDANLLCIPSENSVANLFGKIPFLYDVSKGSLFRAKIDLLVFNLLTSINSQDFVPPNVFRKYRRRWRRRLTFRRIDTLEAFTKRQWLGVGVFFGVTVSILGANFLLDWILTGQTSSPPSLLGSLFSLDTQNTGELTNENILVRMLRLWWVPLFYVYFAIIWDSVFLLYLTKVRTNLAIRSVSTGPIKTWSALSLVIDGFIVFWIFPVAVLMTLLAIGIGVGWPSLVVYSLWT